MRDLRETDWNTYITTAYTHDVAQDKRSQGGVHHHQVRKSKTGFWLHRILQANGKHEALGPVHAIPEAEGEAHFATACLRWYFPLSLS
jgi:hypothetical protein